MQFNAILGYFVHNVELDKQKANVFFFVNLVNKGYTINHLFIYLIQPLSLHQQFIEIFILKGLF